MDIEECIDIKRSLYFIEKITVFKNKANIKHFKIFEYFNQF